jgi:glycosyltransferase involved in cell wall biosynthesis
MLLKGLRELEPRGRWILWGPSQLERYAWSTAELSSSTASPIRLAAQHDAFKIPRSDIVLWMHAVRPLVKRTSIVFVHDLIPAHFAPSALERFAWRRFFLRSCRTATMVVTQSEANRELLAEELGLHAVVINPLPIDTGRAERIRALRLQRSSVNRLLYVGQVKPHKNLVRAVRGFLGSDFATRGAVFSIVAGTAVDRRELARVKELADTNPERIEILPRQSEEELDRLYASASALIQPSLEEGFGLPVVEALSGGISVCCSDIPALREAAQGQAELFDPKSIESVSEAIDRTVQPAGGGQAPRLPVTQTEVEFASRFMDLIQRLRTS